MRTEIEGTTLELTRGDITEQQVGAVVNTANRQLEAGGGVDGAIRRAGGPAIAEECNQIGGCAPGSAVVTTAGDLPADRIIHAVGPVWRGGNQGERELLAGAYRSSLEIALGNKVQTLAFPSISTGAHGYPLRPAARVALETVMGILRVHPAELDCVRFVLRSQREYETYSEVLSELLEGR